MTDADRLILQALTAYDADMCSCGHPRAQAWNPDHDPADFNHKAKYETGPPFRCFACTALAKSQARYSQMYGEEHSHGAYWVTQLVPRGMTLAM